MEKNENDGAIYGEFVKLSVRHVPNFVTQWGRFIHPPPTQADHLTLFLKTRSQVWHPETKYVLFWQMRDSRMGNARTVCSLYVYKISTCSFYHQSAHILMKFRDLCSPS